MNYNWYIELGLEFDPPVEDEKIISDRIEEKRNEWTRKMNLNRAKYEELLSNISIIKDDLIGPKQQRKRIAEEAKRIKYKDLDKYIKLTSYNREITIAEVKNLSNKFKIDENKIIQRAKDAELTIVDINSNNDKDEFRQFEELKPQDKYFAKFQDYKKYIEYFNVKDLYGFLRVNNSINDKELKNIIENRKNDFPQGKTDPPITMGQRACSACEQVFVKILDGGTETLRKKYDNYLKYNKIKVVLDDIKFFFQINNSFIPEEKFKDFSNELWSILGDKDKAKNLLIGYLKDEKIEYATGEVTKDDHLLLCRCGAINQKENQKCSKCGLDLYIICPQCKAKTEANNNNCPNCGENFQDINTAESLYNLARIEFNKKNYDDAKRFLLDAKKYWLNDKIKVLEDDLNKIENSIKDDLSLFSDAYKNKEFNKAINLLNKVNSFYPGKIDINVKNEIESKIEEANRYIKLVSETKDVSKICDYYNRALKCCKDIQITNDLIPIPDPISQLSVNPNPIRKCNNITWAKVNDDTIVYVLVRNLKGSVNYYTDGNIIYEGLNTSYIDKDIEAGRTYYYNIFAKRVNTYSTAKANSSVAVTNCFEIENVVVNELDRSLEISWNKVSPLAEIRIYSILGSNEKLEKTLNSDSESYIVKNLQNDMEYTYRVCLNYSNEETKGVIKTAIPADKSEKIQLIYTISKPSPFDKKNVKIKVESNIRIKMPKIGVYVQENNIPLYIEDAECLGFLDYKNELYYMPNRENLYIKPFIINKDDIEKYQLTTNQSYESHKIS